MRLASNLRTYALLFVLSICCLAHGQQLGSINGSVTDPSGSVIVNAEVTVTQVSTKEDHVTKTNSSGEYTVPALIEGTYAIRVSAAGFGPFEADGIILRIAQKQRVDAVLAVGTNTARVDVAANSSAALQTESAEVAGVITGKQITQLVLNGRNFTQLITLTPGVSNQTGQDEGEVGVSGNASYSINGGRTEYNNWEVDGGENLDNGSNVAINTYPSIDAISETKVLTSNYGAQYGRNASGTIEVATKSGTSAFHGDVFEFLRNDAFNARNYFENSVPEYKKHDFGFTLGGPVIIPKIYESKGQQKTFFFYSEEWRRETVPGQTFNQLVPSAAERTGNFSDVCPGSDCPVNPATGTAFPGNQVPVDPTSLPLLTILPNANSGSGGQSVYQASPSQFTHDREELFRVDHEFNDKYHIFYRYIHDDWGTTTATPEYASGSFPTVGTNVKGPGLSMVANMTAAFTPSLLNEFVASYTTNHISLQAVGGARGSFAGNGLYENGFNGLLPNVVIANGTAYGGGYTEGTGFTNWGNADPTYTYRDQLTKTIGRHTLLFGTSMIAAQKNEPPLANLQGTYTFSNTSPNSTGNAFADMLQGRVYSFQQESAQLKNYNRYKIVEPYIQDDWRVNKNLVLNLGIRLSLFGTYNDISGLSGNFNAAAWLAADAPSIDSSGSITGQAGALVPNSGNYFNGVQVCNGKDGVPTSCMQGHLFNPAPRFGFAYDPRGDGHFVIRGGYGIFWEHTNGNEANTNQLEGTPPATQTATKYNFIGYTNSSGGGLQFPNSLISIPTRAQWPYVQQYNLTAETQLPGKGVLGIAYVGSVGTHLSLRREYNQLTPLANSPYPQGQAISNNDCSTGTVNGQALSGDALNHLNVACGNDPNPYRPFVGLGGINRYEDTAHSNYNALQVSLRRYFGHFSGSLAYTYSHSLDNASDGSSNSELPNSYATGMSYASSNFDQRHLLEISAVYDLPSPFHNEFAKQTIDGWQISDLTSFQTGAPFSVINDTFGDNAGVGNTITPVQSYPDVIGNIHAKPAARTLPGIQGPRLYNAAAFAAPTGLTFGDAGRNILRIPTRTDYDMGLFKQFPIREDMHFEFRAEAFNVFNHTQWSQINNTACYGSDCDSSQFLTPTAAHNPRILQLAGKFVF